MATREGGGYAFNWFLIGFVVGVAATLAAMLYMGVRHDARVSGESEIHSSAAPAEPEKAARPAVVHAPPAVKKPEAAPREDHPRASQRDVDAQMAEDAAAAGMTSRTNPGQAASPSPDEPH